MPSRVDAHHVPLPPTSPTIDDLRTLSAFERGIARRFARTRVSWPWLHSRIGLRRILAHRLQMAPAEVILDHPVCRRCHEAHGPPVVRTGGTPLFLSIARGDGAAVIAVAHVRVGVDVETLSHRHRLDAVLEALHPLEQSEIDDDRSVLLAWTRTEAYLKALGCGLRRDPGADYVGHRRPELRPVGWQIENRDWPAGHVSAVATRSDDPVHWHDPALALPG